MIVGEVDIGTCNLNIVKKLCRKLILGNCYRLVKAVTSKIIINDWRQRKRINDVLPPAQRCVDIQSVAIGCLHEASEAFLVNKCFLLTVEISQIFIVV